MKILVFSDSHQKNIYMKRAIEDHLSKGRIDSIFHLGDGVGDLESLSPQIPICYADGNYEEYITSYFKRSELRQYAFIELGTYKFYLTHGHKFGVKVSPEAAAAAAKKRGADVLLFGHTHEKYYKYLPSEDARERGFYMFNPGSISRPRDNDFSYGVIEIDDGEITFKTETVVL